MIGALIGAGIAAASSIYGGIKASNAAKKANKIESSNYINQSDDTKNWYDRRYNEDSTQRSDAQRILTITNDAIRQRNRAAAGTAAVTGATEESVAATKAANAAAMSDATSKIAAAGEARKDQIEQEYRTRKSQLDDAHTSYGVGTEINRANNITAATQGVANAAGTLGTSIDAVELQKKLANIDPDKLKALEELTSGK